MHALIIEDDSLTALMLSDVLSSLGFTSFDFASTEARAVALAGRRSPDLITADMRLEQGSGGSAVDYISRHNRAPVVYITGNPETVRPAADAIVLTKPVTEPVLREAIGRALALRA